MENQNTSNAKIYAVNFTEKQLTWISDKNSQLLSLLDLHKRKLIKEIDIQEFCKQTTDILSMILREGEWKR